MPDPFYVIGASPSERTRLKGFFREGEGSPGWLLTSPPVFRYAGFDASTGDIARMVDGERWEATSRDRKMLRLYPDGTLLFRMRADDEFLAWGQARRGFLQSPTLNPIAVVESHASFMHLYKRVLGMLARMPDKVRVQLAFINAMVGQRPLSLTKYYQRGITWVVDPVLYPIHTPNAVAELDIPAEFLVANPDAAALEVLRSFYDLFDAEPALIPFTRQVEGVEQVDVEQIVRLSG